jgi:REP element-mobilizing transposase RayT
MLFDFKMGRHPAKGVLSDPRLPTVEFGTVCTKSRHRWLANPEAHAALERAWRQCTQWLVGPYVIMPDHLHFFAVPNGCATDFDRWVSRWKAHFTHRMRRSGFRWQSGSFHHRIRCCESAEAKRAYMIDNPVRAGLVRNGEAWPYRGEVFQSFHWW